MSVQLLEVAEEEETKKTLDQHAAGPSHNASGSVESNFLLGADIAPTQRPTVERSTIQLPEYSFLPKELHLVVDAAPGR